ncbi:mCG1041709 [Mus musculus]|nr:mCG1041709 [Mus musculus]
MPRPSPRLLPRLAHNSIILYYVYILLCLPHRWLPFPSFIHSIYCKSGWQISLLSISQSSLFLLMPHLLVLSQLIGHQFFILTDQKVP